MLGKALTKAAITAMRESELRTEVLIPLFREMGFQDVEHYHGGLEEQGKDIIMWMPDAIRRRITYGVVVKAGKISGKASGKSSAAEISFQIDQCLGSKFHDPLTLRTYPVDRCLVVASGEIPKEARKSLESALRSRGYDRVVDFMPLDRLWELVEEHLPQRLVWDKLTKLHDILRTTNDHYDVVATAGGAGGMTISLQEKYPGAAAAAPLSARGTLQFPKTPAGKKALKQLKEHFRTGAPVTVPKEFIAEFEVPDIIKQLMGTDAIEALQIGPAASDIRLPATAEVIDSTGESVTLAGLEFRVLQSGTKEATISNAAQALPWTITIRLKWQSHLMVNTFSFRLQGVNVKQAHDALRFQRALARGRDFLLRHAETGLTIFGGPIPPGKFPAPPEGLIPLAEALETIQQKTNTPIAFDLDHVSLRDEQIILQIAERVRTGRFQASGGEINVTANRQGAEALLRNPVCTPEDRFVVTAAADSRQVLGQTVDLGPVVIVIEGMYLSDHNRRVLEKALADDPSANEFPTTLTAPEDKPFTIFYPNCLPLEERPRVQSLLDRGLASTSVEEVVSEPARERPDL